MASRDWIQQTNARLQELHTLRVRYVHALETSVDPHVLRTHTKEIEKIDTEIAHLQAAMQFADQRPASMPATPGPSDGEPESFNRDEYTDILDDGERPTEHWDPNAQVGPGGQTMAEALAQLRAGGKIAVPGDDSVVTEQYQRTQVKQQHPGPGAAPGPGSGPPMQPPPAAYIIDDAVEWKPNRNNQLIVGGLILFATLGVLLYVLMN